jgi:hypothetical protein
VQRHLFLLITRSGILLYTQAPERTHARTPHRKKKNKKKKKLQIINPLFNQVECRSITSNHSSQQQFFIVINIAPIMNYLLSFLEPEVESIHSSEQFGNAMVQGMVDGLEKIDKYDGFRRTINVKVRKTSRFYGSGDEIGDIDLALQLPRVVSLPDIFPKFGVMIRPQSAYLWEMDGVLIESKRSCSPKDTKKKIDRFLRFYENALDRSKIDSHHSYHFENGDLNFAGLRRLLYDERIPVLFLFNGSDGQDAYKYLESRIPSLTIHGHAVAVVFAQSDELTKWSDEIEHAAKLAAKEAQVAAELAAKDAQLAAELAAKDAQLAAELAAKDAQLAAELAAKDAQLAAKDAQLATKDEAAAAFRIALAAKDALIEQYQRNSL